MCVCVLCVLFCCLFVRVFVCVSRVCRVLCVYCVVCLLCCLCFLSLCLCVVRRLFWASTYTSGYICNTYTYVGAFAGVTHEEVHTGESTCKHEVLRVSSVMFFLGGGDESLYSVGVGCCV